MLPRAKGMYLARKTLGYSRKMKLKIGWDPVMRFLMRF